MLTALLLQTSLLVQPMYISDAPPITRTARNILLLFAGAPDAPATVTRTKADTLELAADLVARLRHGADFEAVAAEYSQARNARSGAVLGTYALGMLAPELDRALFSSEIDAVSDPLETAKGIHVLQRVETRAAVLRIQVDGQDEAARKRAADLVAKLRAGADFAELARASSDDKASAKRGGQFAIYEREFNDTGLKSVAFSLKIGDIAGPIEAGADLSILKRVALADVDASLAENYWFRPRAILIRSAGAAGTDPEKARSVGQAKAIADDLVKRIQSGEDMKKLARELDEDTGGKEREGDLGWVHRYAPDLAPPLVQCFLLRVGEVSRPIPTPLGYVILRREK